MNVTTAATFDQQIPLLIRNLEVCLRSGYSLKQSFEIVAKDIPAPLGTEAQWVVDALNNQQSYLGVFDAWLDRIPSGDLDLVLATIKVQFESDGNLADKLSLLGQIIDKRKLT
jgi:tight adherence protein B